MRACSVTPDLVYDLEREKKRKHEDGNGMIANQTLRRRFDLGDRACLTLRLFV